MLGIYVKFTILLVIVKTLRNTFPINVNLVIMELYLCMLRVFIITMMSTQIKEFVAFKGANEIASLIEKYDATLYKSENFAILKYCYDNYTSNAYVDPYIEDYSAVQEETTILQESMKKEIAETVSSLDEKDEKESE